MNGSSSTTERRDGATKVAGATELLWHALAHAVVESSSYAFRLRCLLDAAAVWTSDQEVDWTAITSRIDSGELPDSNMARQWLGAAAWLAGQNDDNPGPVLSSAYEQAVWMLDRLVAAGVEAELMTISGGGHGFRGEDAAKADAAMLAFFDRHLKK